MRLGISSVGGKIGGDTVDLRLDTCQMHFNTGQAIIQLLYADIHPVHAFGQHLLPFGQQIELVLNIFFHHPDLPGQLMGHHVLDALEIVFVHFLPPLVLDGRNAAPSAYL